MSKYIKLEDAIEQVKTEFYGGGYQEWLEISIDNLINRIANLPTIEASEDCINREYLEEQLQLIEDITAMAHIDLGEDPYDETEEITMPISTVRKIFKNAPSVVPSRAEGE